MKRVVIYEFLNTRFEGEIVYVNKFNFQDRCLEKFIADGKENIMEFCRYHNGKDVRYRVNSFIRRDIRDYLGMNINIIEIDKYVLEWCRSKSVKTIEM